MILAAISCGLLLLIGGPAVLAQADRKPEANARPDRVFRAGAATSNITPPLGQPLAGGWSAPPATHVHDELHARCLVLDDPRSVALGNEAVRVDGRMVGRVTTAGYGFSVERSIAYAYLPPDAGPGTPVEVDVFGRWVPGEVAQEPLYDPAGERVKG